MDTPPTITKEQIAKGYDAITEKIAMTDGFYEECLSMHSGYKGAILDLGCGQGLLLKKLQTRAAPGSTFFGIDISEKLCEISRKNNPEAEILVGDVEALTYPDNSFDVITMTEVLEHLLDYDKALSEIRRVLKPGGVLIVSVPNRDWASYDFYDKIRNHSMQPVDDHFFRFEEIRTLLNKYSMKIVSYRGLDNLYYYGWKHSIENAAAFVLPFLHKKMKRIVFKCVNEKV